MTTNPLAPTHRRGQQLQHTFQRPRRDKADPSVKVTLNQAGQHLVMGHQRGGVIVSYWWSYRRDSLQAGYWLHQAGQHLGGTCPPLAHILVDAVPFQVSAELE